MVGIGEVCKSGASKGHDGSRLGIIGMREEEAYEFLCGVDSKPGRYFFRISNVGLIFRKLYRMRLRIEIPSIFEKEGYQSCREKNRPWLVNSTCEMKSMVTEGM